MVRRFGFGEAAVYIAATVIVAALVHLVVVLVLPIVATRDAFARLAPLGPLGLDSRAAARKPDREDAALRRSGPRLGLLPL